MQWLQKSLSVPQSLPGGGVDKTAKEVRALPASAWQQQGLPPGGQYEGQRPDGPTQYVRPTPSPYAQPAVQQAPPAAAQLASPDVAELERELAELRRRLEQRPPNA